MREVWRNTYCADVSSKTPRKKLESLEKFAERFKGKCSKGILEKLRELVGDPVTENSTPWIDKLLRQFLDEVGSRGFKVKDLPDIVIVLEFLGWKAREVPEYQEHLTTILGTISCPPEVEKPSENLTSSKILEHYFTHLGRLIILLPTQEGIIKLLGSFHELLTRPKRADISAIKLGYLYEAVEKSSLPVVLSRLINNCPPEISKNLLEVICDLVMTSEVCCHEMLRENILNSLLPKLEHSFKKFHEKNNKNEVILTIRVIWALMRSAQPSEDFPSGLRHISPPNRDITRSLKNVFVSSVRESSLNSHLKKIRNDLVMIILAGLVAMPSWNLVSSGLATEIIILLKSSQVPSTQEDLFFVKTLLALLCHLAASPFCISMMREKEVICGVLRLLCIDEESKIPGSSSHNSHLVPYVMRTLSTLVPELWEDFVKLQGPKKLLRILEWSMRIESNPSILMESLKALCFIISLHNQDLVIQFKTAGIINLLFKLINRLLILAELTLQTQSTLALLLTTLEFLQKPDSSPHSTSSSDSLRIPQNLLQRFSQQTPQDFVIDDKLLISLGSYTWTCIISSPPTLKRFIENGGTYLILDCLEASPRLPQTVFLGILSDMCLDPHCIPHLSTWRGLDKSKGLLSLLSKIWRDEERRIGVKRTSTGCVEDIELPLMGRTQWRNSFYTKTIENYSPTMESLLGSARPKIYSIRKQLLANSEVYERARDHYKILTDDLPPEDSITLCIVDQFFRFTRGQVWGEVLRYLKQKGVNPLGADGEMLLVMCQRHRECGLYVRDCQERIIWEEKMKERRKEVEDIARIRDARLTAALEAAKTIDLVERTADRGYRVGRRNQQKAEVEGGLRFPEGAPGDCHRTYPEGWNVTTILNQTHRIKTARSYSECDEAGRVSPASSTPPISYDFSHEDWDY
ncbi:cilia- and flagella-associated protein 69-like [Diachasma alloeum]|uniref:cilia- and flagella-associated protein 69-like n=1 Tax=Diachasma alloeum TaxID=454923 RepID=UPI000738282C|nr:cilia- and flagella-associated protein 69-like [Diachasma alloeum]